ncbi:Flp family type IVb pilin [Virgibacillus sediminis]|uniref:Flp family type IVb pilin n=1 Tax=Virgibacillus sediminis TaxID=202260 RepID=A0ABV7A385_9BACI
MLNKIKGLFVEEQGQGMTEYGLILGLISVGAVAVLVLFGPELKSIFQKALDGLKGTTTVG